jgi:hypothetical protein
MDLTGIIAVSGMSGLYKVIAQSRNGLVVESLVDKKRLPVHASAKVSALDDISIYGNSEDIPLKKVFESIRAAGIEIPSPKAEPQVVRKAFADSVKDYSEDRVYTSDMKKVFLWYALLDANGNLDAEAPSAEGDAEKTVDKAAATPKPAAKPKETPKASAPKASTKGMAKTQTVRKTGA